MKILIFADRLNNTSGISKHILYLLDENKDEKLIEYSILTGSSDSYDLYQPYCSKIIVDYVFSHKNRSITNYFKSILKLIYLVRINKFDIIHSHFHYQSNIASIVSFFTGIVTVQTIHGINYSKTYLNKYPSKNLIAVNEHIIKHLHDISIVRSKNIQLIRCGVKKEKFGHKTKGPTIRIIAASRFVYEKGIDIYLDAIKKLEYATQNKCEFILAGAGELEKEILDTILKNKFKILYLKDCKNLQEIFSNTDIFIFPSRSQSEGFPITLVEAALQGNLIITSNFLGYDYIFSKPEYGIFFQNEDAEDLSRKIIYAVTNYFRLQKNINELQLKIEKEFNIKKSLIDLYKYYSELVE